MTFCFHELTQFTQKIQIILRPTISHFKAMVMDKQILEGQGLGSFKDLPRPFSLKGTLFTNRRPVLSQNKLDFCPSRIKMLNIRTLKGGIVCLCTIFQFLRKLKKTEIRIPVYSYIF